MKAKDIKALTDKHYLLNESDVKLKIYDEIKNNAKLGLYSLTISFSVYKWNVNNKMIKRIIKELKSNGYKVEIKELHVLASKTIKSYSVIISWN